MRRFLIFGRTGVGKSSFVNAAFGVSLAKTCDFEACTTTVDYYVHRTLGREICLVDTPGLAGDDVVRDQRYLTVIKNKVNLDEIFAFLYLSKLNETRFYADEKRTLELLTRHLGVMIWQRAWLILTFAASVSESNRANAVTKRTEQIEEYLQTLACQNSTTETFNIFQKRFLIDNIVTKLCADGTPIAAALTR